MTTSFTEFLRQEAEKHQAEVIAGEATVAEWREAVQRLFVQMRAWLKASDPDGVIRVKESLREINEPGLGRYEIPSLELRVFGKWIGIIPKARHTIGSARPPLKSAPERAVGRIDITDELRRFVLYRFRQDGEDLWMIGDTHSDPKMLTEEAFEAALMSYLR